MIIEISGLVKKFGDLTAVNNIDLGVKEGEIFGLLGPNGAGKSTTLNTIVGLIKPNQGSIQMFGKDFAKHAKEIKGKIGYVPQDLAFFEEMSAITNVEYWGRVYGLKGAKLKQSVKEALEFTGLWERRKSRSKDFSGGMKRRLNIACGIVHKPKLLLMDEPTVGVDPQSRNNILESIRTLNKNGTTVIYTSHYMEEIEALCSRVAIMDFGKIIAQGTIDELIDSISDEKKMTVEVGKITDKMLADVKKAKGVKSCEQEDNRLHIIMEKEQVYLTSLIESIVADGAQIKAMDLEKPNLETVFLQLTGKKLRD